MTTLVTGGTGRLGRHAVDALRAHGHAVRILSRRPGTDHVVADLDTGDGLAAALAGVDTVLHLATSRSKDIGQTRRLLDALAGTGAHLVFISIVGVDRIPFGYYRDKVASEQAIAASGVPYTIIRVAQFHGFVSEFLDAERRLPVTLVLPISAQTIHLPEVAERLVELAEAGPQGRVADLGGPEQLTLRAYAQQWQEAHGIRRPIWTLHLPGKLMKEFRSGAHMPGLPGAGHVTFRDYLAEEVTR
ncbi:SDR family oxidoreductase [Protaetiibacter larvae]|uniref:NAD(P)H-binding protein n=1 Tax=Protaetiibacter larvae TaxID=2592654 RepID=A0A5C1Y988_9MICO|nr:NAD(P)H-binding protein [Protaetiibacter larvae]QEO09825.1 NAD(P)H-binding protein [Protaetiibacter larvae]